MNISSILCVITNPPPILMADINAAAAAIASTEFDGAYPPPIRIMPPAAVIPEMAFVTDMRGEWRAWVTPHTVW